MADAETAAESPAEAAEQASEAAEAAERAALIAELDSEADGEAAPAKKRSKDTEEIADADGDDAEAEDDEGETEPEESAAEISDAVREHVKSLVEAGDIRKLEEALGLEKGALKVDGAKFRHLRQRAEKATRAEANANAKHAETNTLLTQARQEYGPMVQAKHLFAAGTPQGVQQAARFVEKHFQVPLATFVETVLKAGRGEAAPQRGPDPEVAELKQTVLQLKQTLEQRQQQETEKAQSERHVTTIRGKLAGTAIAKLPDAAQLVYARIKGSYDSSIDGYTLTLKDAIAAVAEDPATKWRLHEAAQKSKPKTPSATPAPVKATNGSRKPVTNGKSRMSPAEQEAAEKAALIAELEAAERKAERALRHAKH